MQPFVSNGLLTGRDEGEDPAACDVRRRACPAYRLADVEEAMHWFRLRADRPATAFTFEDGEVHVLKRWSDFLPGMEDKK
jgi:peptidoglycan/xylan/chitin deacetylase (PgdA/CDA1 family)